MCTFLIDPFVETIPLLDGSGLGGLSSVVAALTLLLTYGLTSSSDVTPCCLQIRSGSESESGLESESELASGLAVG